MSSNSDPRTRFVVFLTNTSIIMFPHYVCILKIAIFAKCSKNWVNSFFWLIWLAYESKNLKVMLDPPPPKYICFKAH